MFLKKCWCSSIDYKKYANFRTKILKPSSPKLKIVKCNICGTIRMLDNSLKNVPDYSGSYEYQCLSGRHYRTISTIKKFYTGESLIDVGCNTGILLSEIKKTIPQLTHTKGIDLDDNAINIGIKKYGLNLEPVNLTNLRRKYDNIVLCHTLEHISDLNSFLKQVDEALNPNGKIFISIPNVQSLNARLCFRVWKALAPLYHIWYFDKSSITKCINSILPHYTIIHSSTYFTWPPFYYSPSLWTTIEKRMPFVVTRMEDLLLGDQLDIVLEKSK